MRCAWEADGGTDDVRGGVSDVWGDTGHCWCTPSRDRHAIRYTTWQHPDASALDGRPVIPISLLTGPFKSATINAFLPLEMLRVLLLKLFGIQGSAHTKYQYLSRCPLSKSYHSPKLGSHSESTPTYGMQFCSLPDGFDCKNGYPLRYYLDQNFTFFTCPQ